MPSLVRERVLTTSFAEPLTVNFSLLVIVPFTWPSSMNVPVFVTFCSNVALAFKVPLLTTLLPIVPLTIMVS